MLGWFKKSSPILQPIDFSVVRVDIHSHLIPAIDDGAKDLDDSISIIKDLKNQGFSKIITTPHIMSDLYKNTPETINSGLEILKKRLTKDNIEIDISVAAEYYVDYDFEQRIGNEKFMTFGEKYILIEFSFLESPRNMFDIIFKLQLEGYIIVLAHKVTIIIIGTIIFRLDLNLSLIHILRCRRNEVCRSRWSPYN